MVTIGGYILALRYFETLSIRCILFYGKCVNIATLRLTECSRQGKKKISLYFKESTIKPHRITHQKKNPHKSERFCTKFFPAKKERKSYNLHALLYMGTITKKPSFDFTEAEIQSIF